MCSWTHGTLVWVFIFGFSVVLLPKQLISTSTIQNSFINGLLWFVCYCSIVCRPQYRSFSSRKHFCLSLDSVQVECFRSEWTETGTLRINALKSIYRAKIFQGKNRSMKKSPTVSIELYWQFLQKELTSRKTKTNDKKDRQAKSSHFKLERNKLPSFIRRSRNNINRDVKKGQSHLFLFEVSIFHVAWDAHQFQSAHVWIELKSLAHWMPMVCTVGTLVLSIVISNEYNEQQ